MFVSGRMNKRALALDLQKRKAKKLQPQQYVFGFNTEMFDSLVNFHYILVVFCIVEKLCNNIIHLFNDDDNDNAQDVASISKWLMER